MAQDAQAQAVVLHDAHGAVAIHAALRRACCGARRSGGTLRSEDDSAAALIDSHQAALAAQLRAARAAHLAGARSVVVAHAFVLGGSESESERPLSVGSGAVSAALFDGFDYVALGFAPPAAGGRGAHPVFRLTAQVLVFEADHSKSVNLVELDANGVAPSSASP